MFKVLLYILVQWLCERYYHRLKDFVEPESVVLGFMNIFCYETYLGSGVQVGMHIAYLQCQGQWPNNTNLCHVVYQRTGELIRSVYIPWRCNTEY